MGAAEFLQQLDQIIFETKGERLSDLRRGIFLGVWDKQTYKAIAETLDYAEPYIRDEGAQLFRLLTEVIGEKVTKANFRGAIERYYTTLQAPVAVMATAVKPDPNPNESNGLTNWAAPIPEEVVNPNFMGRATAIADLNQRLAEGNKIILIQGEGGRGKTTLARKFFKTQGFDCILELWMATETRNITRVENVVEEWLKRDFNEEPGRDFGINLDRLKRKLREPHQRVGILIDNLESALDANGKFVVEHRLYVELLKALADSRIQAVTLITSRERLSESSLTIERYYLEGLDEPTWRQFFQNRGLPSADPAIAAMCNAYGGNAKAMKLLSGVIWQDFEGDVTAFWQQNSQDLLVEPELKDLVASQFDRLQNSNPDVYQLLCRLGCYRYQDVNHISIEAVECLLWDTPKDLRRSVIRSLQDRSLIEVRKGKYWLHPVIRAEAIARLRHRGDWHLAHLAAADYWLSSVPLVNTVDDALRALEAYYHYLEIQEYERACNVLTEFKHSRWGEGLPLGWLFYRLGLLQQMITAITGVIHNVQPDYRAGSLYNLLGYIYRLAGSIHQALDCHQRAAEIGKSLHLDTLITSSLFNRGLCLRDLAEVEAAIAVFEEVIAQAETIPDSPQYKTYSLCCLAYLASCQGRLAPARELAQQAIARLALTDLTFWGEGYSLLFLATTYGHLQEFDQARQLYQAAIALATENDFTQIRAKALHGIAQLQRQVGDFESALEYHLHAIHLLDQLGAKCDLAEAYYQLGITHYQMGDRKKSHTDLHQALQLFNTIQAPKQAAQVLQLLNCNP